ncbi:MAG: uncharacterized protein A8A55_1786 [Amphiamblys sp. WSBS2006]|nr:MAG: uncharacterized protein A8A55_1786 [Amphiamblys sp. WSBS2006]
MPGNCSGKLGFRDKRNKGIILCILYMSEEFAAKPGTEKGEEQSVCVASGTAVAYDPEQEAKLQFKGKEQQAKGMIVSDLIENPLAKAGSVIDARRGTVDLPKLGGADTGLLTRRK